MSGNASDATPSLTLAQTIQSWLTGVAIDVVGLGFAGASIFGFVTGHLSVADQLTVTSLAALYLGIKVPTS
jgi:hypothetical protein